MSTRRELQAQVKQLQQQISGIRLPRNVTNAKLREFLQLYSGDYDQQHTRQVHSHKKEETENIQPATVVPSQYIPHVDDGMFQLTLKERAAFHQPTQYERVQAAQYTCPIPLNQSLLTTIVNSSWTQEDTDLHRPIPVPTSREDWRIANQSEPAEGFDQFLYETLSRSGKMKPITSYGRKDVYLQPIGKETETDLDLPKIVQFLHGYFPGFTFHCLPTIQWRPAAGGIYLGHPIPDTFVKTQSVGNRIRCRTESLLDAVRQVYTLLDRTSKQHRPNCVMGITMFDLYDTDSDLFVVGQAQSRLRVGIQSFARYDPKWTYSKEEWYHWVPTHLSSTDRARMLNERSIRTIVHEYMHLFLMGHCHYYNCIMQGSGHIDEDVNIPMHLCPICLKKLGTRLYFESPDFHFRTRYEQVLQACTDLDVFPSYQQWLQKRLSLQ